MKNLQRLLSMNRDFKNLNRIQEKCRSNWKRTFNHKLMRWTGSMIILWIKKIKRSKISIKIWMFWINSKTLNKWDSKICLGRSKGTKDWKDSLICLRRTENLKWSSKNRKFKMHMIETLRSWRLKLKVMLKKIFQR
jgi:hypothetical protein